jgi:hypothetical protein
VLTVSSAEQTTRSHARVAGRACMNTSYRKSPTRHAFNYTCEIGALSNACLDGIAVSIDPVPVRGHKLASRTYKVL